MSRNDLPQKIQGSVTLHLTGPLLTQLIDRALGAHLQISHVRWVDEKHLELTITLKDFYALRPLLKQTKTRMRIHRKQGFPFLFMRMKRRKLFVVGILLFILMIYAMSSVVWRVEVEGNERIPSHQILGYAQEAGVYPGQWKRWLPDRESVQHRLLEQLPQTSWVGFRLEGTRAIITVVEKQEIDEQEKKDKSGPVDLVAGRNGMIYDMRIEQGRPMVEVNDVVKKGQILVSGMYGEPEEESEEKTDSQEQGHIIGAKGKVLGEVWYESEVVVPLVKERKVYTGNRSRAIYPYVGSKIVRIPFLYPVSYKKYETVQRTQVLHLGKRSLPFGWVEEERLEMKWVRQELSRSEAIALGRERARSDLLAKIGPEGKIIAEKVLHPRVVSGKVYIRIHFDVVENIAVPRPIMPSS